MSDIQRLQHTSVPMSPNGADRARAFYGEALGLPEIPPPRELGHLAVVWFRVGTDGQEIHCFTEASGLTAVPAQHLCFQVADLAALRRRLEARDIPIEEAEAIRNRPRCFVRDPFGNLIELTRFDGPYDPDPRRGV